MGYDIDLDPAEHTYSHARAFGNQPAFALVAGVDPDPDFRSRFAADYGARAYASVSDALDDQEPDVVVIAAPTAMHARIVKEVLARCVPRAILCEKPLASDFDEAKHIVAACKRGEVPLFVNYMRRSDPAVIEVRRRIDSGEIALPVKGTTWYSKGFLHNGSHFFNLAEYWLGPMKRATVLDSGRKWEGTDPEPDVRVEFEKGTITFFSAWEESFSHYTVELLSRSGRLRYERRGEFVEWQAAGADPYFKGYTTLAEEGERIPSGMKHYQRHVADQLAAALVGDPFHLCSGDEALRTLKSMQEIIGQ